MPRVVFAVLVWIGFASTLRAHDPGLSTLHVTGRESSADFVLQFAPADFAQISALDTNKDGSVERAEFEAGRDSLSGFAAGWLRVVRAGQPEPLLVSDGGVDYDEAGSNVLLRASAAGATDGTWTLTLPRMGDLAPGHRQFVTVTDASGTVVVERLVAVREPQVTIVWPVRAAAAGEATSAAKGASPVATSTAGGENGVSFWGFLKLGIEHILTGYDHLLFLAGLLVVCRRRKPVLAVITSFTVAHSLTLALATLNVVNAPSRIVEPLIAASIVFVGVENILRRGEPRGRWALTFVFGLIHGFGFAGVLRELGVGEGGRAMAVPLLSFNLGVELGQIAVAVVFLPLLWWAQRSPSFERRVLPVLSGVVAAAGLYWLIDRLT